MSLKHLYLFIFSPTFLLLLLLSSCSGHIPFYCKIRKTNCKLRPESSCCKATTTTSTPTATTTTPTTTTPTTTTSTITPTAPSISPISSIDDGVTTIASVDSTENIILAQDTDHTKITMYEEVFQAAPSEIDQVFVKFTGENIEVGNYFQNK